MKSQIFIILCLLAAAGWAEEAKHYFVRADVVNVREKPDGEASIVGRLRIGNIVYTSEESQGWARIDSVLIRGVSRLPRLNGWIFLGACTEKRVDIKYVSRLRNLAVTLEDRIKWSERRAALKPDEKMYLEELQKLYFAAGDTSRALAVGQKLRRTDPTFLAHVIDNRCYLLGVIDSARDFRKLSWKQTPDTYTGTKEWTIYNDSDKVSKSEVEALRVPLAGILWYKQNSNAPFQFVSPEIVPDESYTPKYDGKDRYYADIDGTITFRLDLGEMPYAEDNSIVASKPFNNVKTEGIKGKKDFALLGKYKTQLAGTFLNRNGLQGTYYAYLPEYGYTDVVLHGYIRGMWYLTLRGVFDSKGKRVWPNESENYDTREFETPSSWFRFGKDSTSPAYSVIPYTDSYQKPSFEEHNGRFGYQVVRIGKEGTKVFYATREYAGD